MRILVTGGLGVNGSWITRLLLERGHEPVVFENREDLTLVPDIAGQFPLVIGDILDLEALERACREFGVSRVIHLAALMPGASQEYLLHGFQVNAVGALNVFEAARRAGCERVVFTSSKSAYGRIPEGPHGHPRYEPLREDHPCDPVIAYDIGKLAAEVMGRNYQADYGLQFTALRFGTIYAPGKLARHGRMGIHSWMIENAMAGTPTTVEFGGDQVDDVMYVHDVATGTVLAALVDNAPSPIYNIASGQGNTVKQFADAIRVVVPDAEISIGEGLDYLGMGINYYSVSDIALARRELGYEPAYDPVAGITSYIETMGRLGIAPTVA